VNLNDWRENSQVVQNEVKNPARGESGQPEKIRLHNGFHDFLRRERLDTNTTTTKFDRIVSRVEPDCKNGWT
jgi:hypothetical protein